MKNTDLRTNINYQKIFESSPSLFLLLMPNAPDFTIIDASEKYLEATLTRREEIINRRLFDVFPENPNDLESRGTDNLRNSLETVIATKQQHIMALQKYDIPVPISRGGGGFEERYWNPLNTPVLNNQNEILYIVHKVEDVTSSVLLQKDAERKSAHIEESESRINIILTALLKYTSLDFSTKLVVSGKGDELDAIISGLNSLSQKLENHINLLKSTNQELEYANKELDSFSYSVSHDLRAPLRAINGFSRVLLEDYGDIMDNNGKHIVDVIIKNAQRMGVLIDDLLSFSRLGKQNLIKTELSIEKIVDSVIQEVEAQSHHNIIEFKVGYLDNSEGDSSMLKLVFTNLISNAVKYSSKKDKAVIEIGSFKEEDQIIYYVKDNGAGFDMRYYDKLFGVFQRLHSSAEFEGTGVGLALVQRIIKKHSGKIWAESTVNHGATFYVSLPLS